MNPNSLIRHRRDFFVASRNPFAARWSTLLLLPFAQAPLVLPVAAGPDDVDPADDEDLEDEDEDEFEDDDDAGDEGDEDPEPTTESDGQLRNTPDALTDRERPGGPQNGQGDRGGVS